MLGLDYYDPELELLYGPLPTDARGEVKRPGMMRALPPEVKAEDAFEWSCRHLEYFKAKPGELYGEDRRDEHMARVEEIRARAALSEAAAKEAAEKAEASSKVLATVAAGFLETQRELDERKRKAHKNAANATESRLEDGRDAAVREFLRPEVERMHREDLKVSEIVRAINSPERRKEFIAFWESTWPDEMDKRPPDRITRKRIRTILGK